MAAFATRESALQWHPVSYEELYREGLNLATGLIMLGVRARDHLGLFGDIRYEWMLADYGVQLCGAADVPRGRDVSDAELQYIIDHAGIEVSFVETRQLANRLLKLKDQLPGLKHIIMLDPKANAPEGVLTLDAIRQTGAHARRNGDRRAEERIAGIRPDDLIYPDIYIRDHRHTQRGDAESRQHDVADSEPARPI